MHILTTKIAANMIQTANLTLPYSIQRAKALLEQGVPDPRMDWAGHMGALETLVRLLTDNEYGATEYNDINKNSLIMEEGIVTPLDLPPPETVLYANGDFSYINYGSWLTRYVSALCRALGFDHAAFERLAETPTKAWGGYRRSDQEWGGGREALWVGPKERLHKLERMRKAFAPPHVRTGSWVNLKGEEWLPLQAGDQFLCPRERGHLVGGGYASTRCFVLGFRGKLYVEGSTFQDAGGNYHRDRQTSYPVFLLIEGDLYQKYISEDWVFQGREGLRAASGHWWEWLKQITWDTLPPEWRAMRSRIRLPGETPFTEGEAPAVEEATA